MDNRPQYNSEGYADPTAFKAIKAVSASESDERVTLLIKAIKSIISLSGFVLINRIELKEKNTGRIFK